MTAPDGIDDPDLAEALLNDQEGGLSREVETFLRTKLAALPSSEGEDDFDSAKVRKACNTALKLLEFLPALRKPSPHSP